MTVGGDPRMHAALVRARLRADALEEYDRLHRDVPEAVRDAIGQQGVRDWTIWREGAELHQIVIAREWADIERALTDQPGGWSAKMAALTDSSAPPVPVRSVHLAWMLRGGVVVSDPDQ